MFIVYGDFQLSFAMLASNSGASFLTDSSALNDFHSGLIASAQWCIGAQTTASYVDIKFTANQDWIGGVGLVNVQGLPEATLIELLSSDSSGHTSLGTQRLRQGPNGKLQAWFLPMLGAGQKQLTLRIHNNVNNVATIAASAVWGAGEVVAGHAIYLPTMMMRQPSSQPIDPSALTTQDAGSVFATMRNAARSVNATLGTFSTADVNSIYYSTISDGKGGKISLRRLQEVLLQSNCTAICDIASAGRGAGVVKVGAGRIDQEFMQENWMLARLQNQGGSIIMDQPPRWSWQTSWRQSI
jgi:hypothetical protein